MLVLGFRSVALIVTEEMWDKENCCKNNKNNNNKNKNNKDSTESVNAIKIPMKSESLIRIVPKV